MLAVVKSARRQGALAVKDMPVPEAGPHQVLIRVRGAAVCGSDLHAYNYDPGYEFIQVPVVLGHEFSGTVVEAGSAVEDIQAGDRVVAEATQYCGRCSCCLAGRANICENFQVTGLHLDGGMAEYACIDARFAHRLPEGVGYTAGALVEPASVAVHGVADNCRIRPGDVVVVTGAGAIGLLAAQVARAMGAGEVTIVGLSGDAPVRLRWAVEHGFRTVCLDGQDPCAESGQVSRPGEADVVIECSGGPEALAGATGLLRKGGQLTVVGLYARPAEIFFTAAVRKEIVIRTSYSSRWVNYEQAIRLINSGQVEVESLARVFPLADAVEAFQASLQKEVVKAVLKP